MPDKSLIIHSHFSPLIKIDVNSDLIWALEKESWIAHHSLEPDSGNSFWVCIRYNNDRIKREYIDNQNGVFRKGFRNDGIAKISYDGDILFEKGIAEILFDNNLDYYLYNYIDKEMYDPFHLNDVQPVNSNSKFWEEGDVFLSLRNLNLIILYRPSTNKVIREINGENHFFKQHDVDIIDEKRISIFNNNSTAYYSNINSVVIYDFEKNSFYNYLDSSMIKNEVKTKSNGLCEILPNGDLFVEETNRGRLLYFNSNGSLKWSFLNRSDRLDIRQLAWSRILYKNDDLKVVRGFLKTEVENE